MARSNYGYSDWAPYVPVAERRRQACVHEGPDRGCQRR